MLKNRFISDLEMALFLHTYNVDNFSNKNEIIFSYLTKHTGKNIKDYQDIDDIYSNLYIETLYNFTLPDWTQTVYPEKLKEPACYRYVYQLVLLFFLI